MPPRRSSRSEAIGSRNTAEWPATIGDALSELRNASTAFPKLFPNGITKIEIELRVASNTTVRFLVEGPPGATEALLSQQLATAFEFRPPPESLRTDASPTEGTSANQAKLKAGTTIEGTAKVFNHDCL